MVSKNKIILTKNNIILNMKFLNMKFFLFNTCNFNNKELPTTDAELNAIAADDIQG